MAANKMIIKFPGFQNQGPGQVQQPQTGFGQSPAMPQSGQYFDFNVGQASAPTPVPQSQQTGQFQYQQHQPPQQSVPFDIAASYQSAVKIASLFDQLTQTLIHLVHQMGADGKPVRGDKNDFVKLTSQDGKEINSRLYTLVALGILEKYEPDPNKITKYKKPSKAPTYGLMIHPIQGQDGNITGYSGLQLLEYLYFTIFQKNSNRWLSVHEISLTITSENNSRNVSKVLYPLLMFLAKKNEIISDPPIGTSEGGREGRKFALIIAQPPGSGSGAASAAAAAPVEGLTNLSLDQ